MNLPFNFIHILPFPILGDLIPASCRHVLLEIEHEFIMGGIASRVSKLAQRATLLITF